MLTRIQKALHNKREDEGFTLIELLVVMIIIGILVAIAVPIFLNQKNKAKETSVKADVKQLGTNMETALTDGTINTVALTGTAPDYSIAYKVGTASATAITGRLSNGNAAAVFVDDNTKVAHYCVTVSNADTNVQAWQMEDGQLSRGDCSASTVATASAGATS